MPRQATHKPAHTIPFRERLTCTVAEAIDASGLGRDTLYRRIRSGELAAFTVGKRRLIGVPSLVALIERAP